MATPFFSQSKDFTQWAEDYLYDCPFYKKDDPLLPSGCLGPVRILFRRMITLREKKRISSTQSPIFYMKIIYFFYWIMAWITISFPNFKTGGEISHQELIQVDSLKIQQAQVVNIKGFPGELIPFCDFASAGNTWDGGTRYRVWIRKTLNVMNRKYEGY